MGLWGKVKGIFGRIGEGIKKGYNWVKNHIVGIKEAADKAKEFIPEPYRPAAEDVIDKGYNTFNKIIKTFG